MKLTIVSCVYPPEPVVSAQTSVQIADFAQSQAACVQVITAFPNRPAGKIYPGYRRSLYKREQISGRSAIIRCFTTLSSHSSILSRSLENITFGIASSLALLFGNKPNVIYADTWPIFAQVMAAWLLARL